MTQDRNTRLLEFVQDRTEETLGLRANWRIVKETLAVLEAEREFTRREVAETQAPVAAEELAPLRLEVGKRYVTRSGTVVGPLEPSNDPTYPFKYEVNTWTPEGTLFANGSTSAADIVGVHPESEAQAPAATEDPEVIRPRAGGFYVLRNGRTVGPLIDTRHQDYPLECLDERWTRTGHYYCDGTPSKKDIVGVAAPRLRVGRRYVMRDGKITGRLAAYGGDQHKFVDRNHGGYMYTPDGHIFSWKSREPGDIVVEYVQHGICSGRIVTSDHLVGRYRVTRVDGDAAFLEFEATGARAGSWLLEDLDLVEEDA